MPAVIPQTASSPPVEAPAPPPAPADEPTEKTAASEVDKAETAAPAEPFSSVPPPPRANASDAVDAPPSSTDGTETTPSLDDSVPFRRPKRGGLGSSVLLAAAVALGIVGFWFVLGPGRTQWGDQAPNPTAPPSEPAAAAPKPAPTPEPERVPTEPAPTAAATAEKPAEPAAPAATGESEAAPTGGKVVTVVTKPEGARLFYKGKEVGITPVKVELGPGEKRSFEVALPGHITRKLVVDGTKSEVVIGLRPEH